MTAPLAPPDAAPEKARRLFVYNGGFVWQSRLRRILSLAGYHVTSGKPGPADLIGVWGASPTSPRGEAIADHTGAHVLRIEDAFLRSLHPGRDGEPPIGLLIDDIGLHFDGRQPSRIEQILREEPLDDTHLMTRARDGIARMKAAGLSKYAAYDANAPLPEPGYVLVVDQTLGDASVTSCGATRATFQEMLFYAQQDHPGARIVVKAHPETSAGHRPGHLTPEDLPDGAVWMTDRVNPWPLLEGAVAVYTVSSQMGFEAILAGHNPVVFGQPFYAGWGLTQDQSPIDRRQRRLTRAQLFAGAMILAPTWYDPYNDRLGTFEDALGAIEAMARSWHEDRHGWTAQGMRLWKRRPLQRFFGQHRPIRFSMEREDRPHMIWAAQADPDTHGTRVEDGFLRSRGLGAALVPPLSLVLDDAGIYYDPTRPSKLEELIRQGAPDDGARRRAEALARSLTRHKISKYNQGDTTPTLPAGRKILVVGQVEDDASIRLGAGDIRTNRDLMLAAREARPDAKILWKPHPDVEAGLRPGAVPDAHDLCDLVLHNVDPADILDQVDGVWTMTSLLGFEALLRGVPVTCTGMPFYAGWDLTNDLMAPPARRGPGPDLTDLIWASLIAYPRYYDPISNLPCPPEVVVDRLASGVSHHPTGLRLLAKAQGALASFSWLWR